MKKEFIILLLLLFTLCSSALAEIGATHIYHNHMPNFWPFYDVTKFDSTPDGSPIRYMYDGDVINAKNSPPENWYFLPDDKGPMPHDNLVSYYDKDNKSLAYQYWPPNTAQSNNYNHKMSQTHVTMSASVINNVNSIINNGVVSGRYNNKDWGGIWKDKHFNVRTENGFPALDVIHFTGHHSMGPLVGDRYFLKDLIYHNVTVSKNYFIGSGFKSSKGFFPTELGFSTRIIKTLKKIGVEWSVLGNVHYSRTLKSYPYLNEPGKDTMVSPPNRADFRNEDPYNGEWLKLGMMNEQQNTYNNFPFASIPHWVRSIDPETGKEYKIAGIPVEQASSWREGFEGGKSPTDATFLHKYDSKTNGRTQYFVLAHDGDNGEGAAGSEGAWMISGSGVYTQDDVTGMGVEEYLKKHPIPDDDVVHVQDGSWIDTRDSSADPTWYHWRLPMGIWDSQFSAFNAATGLNAAPKKNLDGHIEAMTVSFEYGYHYLERNFALLQAAENYAETAEQIWLDENPNHWKPKSDLDFEVVGKNNTKNQLNPYLMSYPIKGQTTPAEYAWYFLIASIDSGFGYYDENVDDGVKPTISFNQSLYFSEPYVEKNISKDKTAPSIWWPQRWPYNPGSANVGKAEGFTLHYFDNNFAIYTYAFDVSGIEDIKVKVRVHKNKRADAKDRTYQVYDPKALKAKGIPEIDPSKVGEWKEYAMKERDLQKDINGVKWQAEGKKMMDIVPAKKIGNLYFTYLSEYRDQLLDYYIEAVDKKGNVRKSEIQQVYVGTGIYKNEGGVIVEDASGDIEGTYPFLEIAAPKKQLTLYVESGESATVSIECKSGKDDWNSAGNMVDYSAAPKFKKKVILVEGTTDTLDVRFKDNGSYKPSSSGESLEFGIYTIYKDKPAKKGIPEGIIFDKTTIYYKGTANNIHWTPADKNGTAIKEKYTTPPGEKLVTSPFNGYFMAKIDLGVDNKGIVQFNKDNNDWTPNMSIDAGIWTFENGSFKPGEPAKESGDEIFRYKIGADNSLPENSDDDPKVLTDNSVDEDPAIDIDNSTPSGINDSSSTEPQDSENNNPDTTSVAKVDKDTSGSKPEPNNNDDDPKNETSDESTSSGGCSLILF